MFGIMTVWSVADKLPPYRNVVAREYSNPSLIALAKGLTVSTVCLWLYCEINLGVVDRWFLTFQDVS